MSLFKLPISYAIGMAVIAGGLIVTGIYTSGQRSERNKQAAEMAKINAPIIEQRAKDEAELAASDKAAKDVDETVKANLKQTLILDKDTALWLGLVK
jgi:hypothetical protein